MATVRGSIEIHRSVEDVFDFVADETNEPRYNEEMLRCERITSGRIDVGTKYEAEMNVRGHRTPMTIEVTAFERPHRLASWSRAANMDIRGEVTFDPISGGTLMSWRWDLHPHGLLRLMTPLVTSIGRRREEHNWGSLKTLLQSEPQRGPTRDAAISA